METPRYTTFARLLHWGIALLFAGQFGLGWWMQSIPKEPPGVRVQWFNLHKSIGLMILALMAARILWRAHAAPPPWPGVAAWKVGLAKANHALLYALLVAMPLSGYLGSVFSGYPVKFFGIVLPAWGAPLPAVKELLSAVHLGISWALAAALVLHLAGAVHGALATGGGLAGRMGWSRH